MTLLFASTKRDYLSLIATRNTPSMTGSTLTATKGAIAVMKVTEKECFYSMRVASSFSVFASVGNSTLATTSTHSA